MIKREVKEVEADFKRLLKRDMSLIKRDIKLSKLMTELEVSYEIPLVFMNKEWENNNSEVLKLYRKICLSRDFLK